MKKYCFDTSGISNPAETMPQDIHESLWRQFQAEIEAGSIAVIAEIYAEIVLIPGQIGECIKDNKDNLIMEVGEENWDWNKYINNSVIMQDEHKEFISEYTGGSSKTICLTDLTIIAMAKTLETPVVSMEIAVALRSETDWQSH